MTLKGRWKMRMFLTLVSFYIGLCLTVFTFQRSLLFFPSHDEPAGILTPWVSEGNTVGYCRQVAQPKTVWLLMHGNAGQAADRDYVLARLDNTDALYVLEYPGYGARAGSPNQQSINTAALEAYELLVKQFPNTPIGVIGESLGSGPAAQLSQAARPPDKIVLVVPYDSLYAVAAQRFAIFPVWLLLRDRWDNIRSLKDYRGPVEIFAALNDRVIPCTHARNLARTVPQAKLKEVRCGHNDWSMQREFKISRP